MPDEDFLIGLPPDEQKKLIKEAFKESMKEWLDAKFTEFGKWSFKTLAVLALAALVTFILWSHGWHK